MIAIPFTRIRTRLVMAGFIPWMICSGAAIAASSDDFNDNMKSATKWGADETAGHGMLKEQNQRLEYVCNGGTADDNSNRPWILTRFPYNADWSVKIDTVNNTAPAPPLQVNSMGFEILNTHSGDNRLFSEFYCSALGGFPIRTGFVTEWKTNDVIAGSIDTYGGSGFTNTAIRLEFDSATKVITVLVDTNISDGYQWEQQASFGIAGSGGTDGAVDWSLSDTDQFEFVLYGYSAGMTVPGGPMYVDNFEETGGVASSGAVIPDPTGSFQFHFPTNNPLMTAIVSIIGNYQGISPTAFHRNYNIDVAQDESGKVTAMGTMDGMQDDTGNPDISVSAGSIKTVNGEPTAQLKGSFKGTRDGEALTFSGAAVTPLEIVDVGGGTNGIAGTGSYKSKIAGVPFSGKNMPIQFAASPDNEENLKKEWTLQLDISQKAIQGKDRTVASAQLLLPNGDTISYPEKVVKYSTAKGYSLSFKGGTNITVNPVRIDKKTSISIKGLTFVQQGTDWEPTGGIISYQFLGQKGTANLMDFVGP